jgi:hypothetical protein
MKTIGLALAIGAATIGLAQAQGIGVVSSCHRAGTCITTIGRSNVGDIIRQNMLRPPSAAIIQMPKGTSQQERAESEERDRKWVEFCEPKLRRGEHGVMYYVYKHRDCEYGRSE